MKIAVEGCCHGELDKIYETIQFLEKKENVKVDLLLCCGDFQAVRNEADMKCMAVPSKYRQMQTFYKYYSGEKKAPVLTIFIGGNHEASNHLQELPYGGWVAPNIYYLGHFEYPPYNQQTIRSAYHVRNIDIFKLKQLKQPMDIFLSHDWPRSIYHYGNKNQLLKKKSFLRHEVETNTLGSPAASELLQHLKPSYWFSAHLHVKFAALMQHQEKDQKGQVPKATKFLALDKCLPHRDFLQIVEVEHDPNASDNLEYDLEWLAVLRATNDLINVTPKTWNMPENNGLYSKWDYSVAEEAIKEVVEDLGHELRIPTNFSMTAASYDPNNPMKQREPVHSVNSQTTEFCASLGVTDLYAKVKLLEEEGLLTGEYEAEEDDADSTGSAEEPSEYTTDTSGLSSSINPDEITLDDDDDNNEDISTHSTEPSPEHPSDFSANFSDIRIVPDSMIVSSDDAMDSTNDELEKSGDSSQTEGEGKSPSGRILKRISGEHENGNSSIKKIKRRNQNIYASKNEDDE
ncbi:lariat debranching enzyme isoform X2 [Latimeria chalumnae]|uniref:lariat debranching enzyme isoform X2 n=1 Tax=Latimeria chalumnae TaxID=7897 RepID=UPI0003C10AB0|nr:PREDICTED: lariat debranching enzyme isoform X2 [Latimeria chalumnae]|eukprot:XP_006010577.1 PREDICTED: lariat debranching enzyme isoform X2 [Latimeria chalumnae]